MRKIFTLVLVSLLAGCNCDVDEIECEIPAACHVEPESGMCMAAFPKYYFDKAEKKCKVFTWGGCGGVVPFYTLEECEACICAASE